MFTKARGGYIYVFGERSDHCPEGAVAQSAITITKYTYEASNCYLVTKQQISYFVREVYITLTKPLKVISK